MISMYGDPPTYGFCCVTGCYNASKWYRYRLGLVSNTIHRTELCGRHKKARYGLAVVVSPVEWLGRIPKEGWGQF